jgi:hypothetical protein
MAASAGMRPFAGAPHRDLRAITRVAAGPVDDRDGRFPSSRPAPHAALTDFQCHCRAPRGVVKFSGRADARGCFLGRFSIEAGVGNRAPQRVARFVLGTARSAPLGSTPQATFGARSALNMGALGPTGPAPRRSGACRSPSTRSRRAGRSAA